MSYLPLLCTLLLLLASVTTHAQPYTLAIDPVVDTVTVGELSTFTISVLPSEGFDASVFINAWSPTLPFATLKLTGPKINHPYSAQSSLTVTPSAGDIGVHSIIVLGVNGTLTVTDTITLIVRHPTEGDRWTIYHRQNSGLLALSINAIEFDRSGTAWITTGQGIYRAAPGEAPRLLDSTFPYGMGAMAFDSAGGFWVSIGRGVARYAEGKWTFHQMPDNMWPTANGVVSIAAAPDGTMWLGGYQALLSLKEENWTMFVMKWGGSTGAMVHDLAVTPDGKVWGATSEGMPTSGGVFRLDGEYWTSYSLPELGDNDAAIGTKPDIAVDDSGNAWVLTSKEMVSPRGPTIVTRPIPAPSMGMIAFGPDGRRWLAMVSEGAPKTIFAEEGASWKSYPLSAAGLPPEVIPQVMKVHPNGSVWIGTREHGLVILTPGGATAAVTEQVRSRSSERMAITPNPITSDARVALVTTGGSARIALHDNIGREIAVLHEGRVRPGEESLPLDLSEVPAGAYRLTLSIDGSIRSSRMVMVAR